jgi:uncharacterized protein
MRRIRTSDSSGREWTIFVPQTRVERVRGLLGRQRLGRGEGLLLTRTRSIHTFGMRYPIEIARLDDEGRVVSTRVVLPSRLVLPARGARHILECAEGAAPRPGDALGLYCPALPRTDASRRDRAPIV